MTASIDIMVVDDSRGDRRLICEAFKEISLPVDYRLHDAGDGVEALQLLGVLAGSGHTLVPDLIILDLNMPRMDGWEFLQTIRTHHWLRELPVIVLTTSSSETDMHEAYRLNANCYVIKPMDIGEFITTVQRLGDFWLSVVLPGKSA